MELNELTCHELHEKLVKKEISPLDIVKAVEKQISASEKDIHAYITVFDDMEQQAALLDVRRSTSDDPLYGIPIAIKDNMCMKGRKTTAGSKILHNFIPPYNAFVIEKLKNAGAIFTGKANMDEFAFGSSTESSHFGPTKNPRKKGYVPGGSSGGSAAAVASCEAIVSLGSDTGGSIRQPASLCGVVGMKPTYGRVSRYGLIAFGSSLDQIGPFSRDVTDCAILLNAISGYDPKDSTSVDKPVPDHKKALSGSVKGMKLGIPKEYFIEGIDVEVRQAVEKAIKALEKLGARRVDISLPHTEYAVATYYIVATAEASSNLERYDGVKYGHRKEGENLIDMYKKTRADGFGKEAKRRIMLGTYVLSAGYYDAYYLKANKVRTLIRQDFEKAFGKADVILTPTSPTPAFRIGEKTSDPLQMYLSDIFTISANLAGIPGISVPCGTTKDGLPVGLQILGKYFAEEDILRAAFAYEQNK
ncbi:Asp-tRNA(Asn)/Glu-tRNA(Gln) amidotransferase GatCAB subunit A [Candidatus Desantisbacteria bacterium CG_4_10_14_0_8_um_filter_48_22]|uniref:Glutamyl-tRNA(Gln) amidotransferase subunit A n=1 Tax=Candidatus Desantisbacteria bacterium CG_4_10_14_0_8_um_filter_48_22 TaxID=1974543 RepID=A0A2M7S857_9BACT|nr:MAG: aspartyl/glutamyl-tRNA amidotransferase subunit A [Candidatus Desantisbacteria bacterium CG1_02_49_89]PIV55963.1 MAG: Asp-tRNA(Asn)/Glu-tRNA(Gln) amidotransferase GatCAB subunit A [Candidatus Desantisbacteria bacterium CG02_land_8_20_14_3_00_49_13]PIZ15503.1 MAG: Asp-tRNA(Asn)/Glu-tRNA(Gln) amidotransferase GatCAB subunit A [Candidatus Desantisbacteria bacterium CG_4_10_14_0_8_um_filter_48_22]